MSYWIQGLIAISNVSVKRFSVLMWISLCASALYGQGVEIRNFIFGHSLIDHRPPKIETPSDETTVPHWIGKLAQQGGHQYAAGGQYGFLPQHAQLPPMSQWGYDEVPGLWDSDIESFAQANINTILMTAGNFMQWQDPDLDYPTDPGVSPISATQDIVDWVENQSDSIHFYIYENWPDMAGYLNNGFPPSESEWLAYDEYTNGSFHDWWIKYHDALLESRSASSIFMIPVGPIIHRIRKEILKDDVAFTSLYEDDAPHGRANLYFLAGLVSYMAIYEEKPVLDFNFTDIIHPVIQQNYEAIIELAWSALLDFKTDDGKSRVFKSDVLSSETPVTFKDEIDIFPNPSRDIVYIQSKYSGLKLDIYDVTGRLIKRSEISKNTIELEVSNWPQGMYFVKIKDEKGQHRGFKIFLVIH